MFYRETSYPPSLMQDAVNEARFKAKAGHVTEDPWALMA